jgi:hypothetical protein
VWLQVELVHRPFPRSGRRGIVEGLGGLMVYWFWRIHYVAIVKLLGKLLGRWLKGDEAFRVFEGLIVCSTFHFKMGR